MLFRVNIRDEKVTNERSIGFSRYGKLCGVEKHFVREIERVPHRYSAATQFNLYEITGFIITEADTEEEAKIIADSSIHSPKAYLHYGDLSERAVVTSVLEATEEDKRSRENLMRSLIRR